MARPALSKAGRVLLPHKSEAAELEPIDSSTTKLLPEGVRAQMFLEVDSGTPTSISYVDSSYDYGAPTLAATSAYHVTDLSHSMDPSDGAGYTSDTSLQPLGTMSTSSLVFMPTGGQVSSFIHHPSPTSQQASCYSEGEQSNYRLWEAPPSQISSRSSPVSSRQNVQEEIAASVDRSVSKVVFEPMKDTRYCAVCNDYASGYHYGVWSCEGCKAFFKRSLQGPSCSLHCLRYIKVPPVFALFLGLIFVLKKSRFSSCPAGHNDYMCPATNQCTIDRNRRKSCQACRLRKCCEVGMMKGELSVLLHKISQPSPSVTGLRKDRLGRSPLRAKRSGAGSPVRASCGSEPRQVVTPALTPGDPMQVKSAGTNRGLSIPAEQFLLLLLNAEPPSICTRQKHSRPYTEVTMMTLLTNLADKELVHMIAWAKKLPGFLELSLHDQVQLLESSWLEVLMIGLIWRSVHFPGKLIFAQDLILDRSEGGCVEGMAEIFDMLLATVSRFRTLQLKTEEFVCLKAIVLLNSSTFSYLSSSVETLHDGSAVQYMLDKITDTLSHYIGKSGLPPQQQARRLSQLLLLLSHIRHMSNKGMEHLYSVKCKNTVPLYDLLLEMLDAHRLRSPGRNEVPKAATETTPMSLSLSLQSSLDVQSS
ncbi:estrogen receptor alpha-like [Scleropages formosus]|uniref:Estrogen receptor n=1 Tax=Scleropages formosus TaxID=113540 RepID=A0A0P7XVC1_SCLFO|nr:estrogen receptor alpha-like [Scleropages formosus]